MKVLLRSGRFPVMLMLDSSVTALACSSLATLDKIDKILLYIKGLAEAGEISPETNAYHT